MRLIWRLNFPRLKFKPPVPSGYDYYYDEDDDGDYYDDDYYYYCYYYDYA